MAFTINIATTCVKTYPELLNAVNANTKEQVEAVVSVVGVLTLTATGGTVSYSITPTGGDAGFGMFDFEYSGVGNPLDEAESALKAKWNV